MTKRGLILYLMGILVNFFGFFISHFVSGNLLGAWDVFPLVGGLLLFYVDILAFACLAFVLMSIVKKFELSNKKLIVIAVLMSIIGSLLRRFDFGICCKSHFRQFIGTTGGFTAFPLFNWFIFPIVGYVWCQYFIRARTSQDSLCYGRFA